MIRPIFKLLILFSSFSLYAETDDFDFLQHSYSSSSLGNTGLIQTPSARFSSEGHFLFGISTGEPINRVYSKVQFFPWMEAVLRYTEEEYRSYGDYGGSQTNKDKGFDLKFLVAKENKNFPQIAIGFNDFGGTGRYSSEYLVATKRLNNLDMNLGIGWGNLAGVDHINNPIRDTRSGNTKYGGKLNFGRLFTGKNVSIFGGMEYFLSNGKTSLKAEYDTTNYSQLIGKEKFYNKKGDIFELESRFNYSINHRFNLTNRETVDLSLGYLRGNTIYANLTIHSNLNDLGIPKIIIGGEKIRNINMPGSESFETLDDNRKKFLTNRIIKEMAYIGFVTHSIIFNGREMAAELSQSRFLDSDKFIDLASRVLANNAPRNIEKITIINIDNGIETYRTSVSRKDLIKSVSLGPLDKSLVEYNSFNPIVDASVIDNEFLYPNFYWEVKPHLNNTLQHQVQFFFWQLEALIHTEYSIKKGLYFTTDIGIDIANNFDKYTYHIPDGKLYHVRQNRRLYLTEGKTGIRRMALDYLFKLDKNISGKISGGYLEWMYGGVGGEILYMPDHKGWAIGMDGYWIKQRDYDQKFSFKEYETVTGFINFYQNIPFYDLRLKLSYGKFLAKDKGAMIDISRRFDSGARVGGFAALTDCDAACVGEGSFHKGVYFELPMDLFFVERSTRNKTSYSWAPLTKDAGAKLETYNLYELMTDGPDEVDSIRTKQWSFRKIFSGFSTSSKPR
ncbi:MAG: hypothetical protein CMD35_08025 [Flavobacteriales bacterium]|nr:hypothetical protein [Flavobacteriales bacterium]